MAETSTSGSCHDIWVFAEQADGTVADVVYELLGKGLELKAQRGDGCRLCAVALGDGVPPEAIAGLFDAGADVAYVVDDPKLAVYDAAVYADAIAQLAGRHGPEVLLAGATAVGRSFFARVAVRLRTGLTADCTALEIRRTAGGEMLLNQTRPAFGGNIMATILTPSHRPQMATVRPRVFGRAASVLRGGGGGQGEIVREVLDLITPKTRCGQIVRNRSVVDIAAADVLVAGGRGMRNATGFALLHELARLLGGEVAASRAAVDAGWADAARQVGQTGKTVRPKLYLCFGVSGAIQHLAGIRGAGRIVAVNNDANAPILDMADLGVIGDAETIVRALIGELGK